MTRVGQYRPIDTVLSSTCLLLDSFWQEGAFPIEVENLVFAIPTTMGVYIADRTDSEAMKKLEETIIFYKTDYNPAMGFPVSDKLYRKVDGRIMEYHNRPGQIPATAEN